MSAKIAVVIGDYSNGWSDAIVVQNYFDFEQKKLAKNRPGVMEILGNGLLKIMTEIESDSLINPKPLDDPCCKEFEEWSKDQKQSSTLKRCPFCGMVITEERRKKFFVEF